MKTFCKRLKARLPLRNAFYILTVLLTLVTEFTHSIDNIPVGSTGQWSPLYCRVNNPSNPLANVHSVASILTQSVFCPSVCISSYQVMRRRLGIQGCLGQGRGSPKPPCLCCLLSTSEHRANRHSTAPRSNFADGSSFCPSVDHRVGGSTGTAETGLADTSTGACLFILTW